MGTSSYESVGGLIVRDAAPSPCGLRRAPHHEGLTPYPWDERDCVQRGRGQSINISPVVPANAGTQPPLLVGAEAVCHRAKQRGPWSMGPCFRRDDIIAGRRMTHDVPRLQ